MKTLRALLAACAVISSSIDTASSIAWAAEPAAGTLALKLNGQFLECKPLAWDDSIVMLMSRDGRLYDFKPSEAKEFRKASPTFKGYSAAEMRDRLQKELGKDFEITNTGHYLVAAPRGSKQDWAPRFERPE